MRKEYTPVGIYIPKFCKIFSFGAHASNPAPMGVKFHPHQCNVLALRSEKPQDHPLSNLNIVICAANIVSVKN